MIEHEERLEFYLNDELEIRQRYWQVQPGDYVVDVGACYGLYTLPALGLGGHVLAIDAGDSRSHTEFPSTLLRFAHMEGLAGRLETCRAALYDGSPYPAELREQGSTDFDDPPWRTLDEVMENRPPVDWLKVDVEGAELGVLRGGLRTLQAHPNLIVEDHSSVYPWVEKNLISAQIVELLQGLDYNVARVPYHGIGGYREYVIAT